MSNQKYSVNQYQIDTFLAYTRAGQIAIPEVQRPFVWDTSRVRDLMDSLYKGYPVGYVITWQNPNTRLKDGTRADGKKILIDGQQRITAMKAAILGEHIVNKEYQKTRIHIAFHPMLEKFEVRNTAIEKNKEWIPDISEVFNSSDYFSAVQNYFTQNPQADQKLVQQSMQNLLNIRFKQIGVIELSHDLDIDTVTEIFIRINNQGVSLSQSDFAMSKMAANEQYGGHMLRKAVDYFCHLAIAPQFFDHIRDNDKEFAKTDYFRKMTWLKDDKDNLYDPGYQDMLRVSFTSEFGRGKMADLVSLLSGRNFETREYEESIAQETYERLAKSVLNFMNEDYFKKFVMIIRSAGFSIPEHVRSKTALNFAYILYLKLRADGEKQHMIERYVRRWLVFSILTGRYGTSPEGAIDFDIKLISNTPFDKILDDVEKSDLSDVFWERGLVQRLDTSVASSPMLHLYFASQVKANDKGFLSRDITVGQLIQLKGDIHHLFPKNYLQQYHKAKTEYNSIANYVLMQQEINIKISNKAPEVYFKELLKQVDGGQALYGGISSKEELIENLRSHCIPESIFTMNVENYEDFLEERRKLMAGKLKDYYFSL